MWWWREWEWNKYLFFIFSFSEILITFVRKTKSIKVGNSYSHVEELQKKINKTNKQTNNKQT